MDREELIACRLAGQHLLSHGAPREVCGGLNGLQAQFLVHACRALELRCGPVEPGDDFCRSWTLRGTMHLFPLEDLPLYFHEGRQRKLRPCDTMQEDARLSSSRKEGFSQCILNRLSEGPAGREELKRLCADSGMTASEMESAFDPWGGLIRALAEAGRLCALPQEKKAYRLCPEFQPMQESDAWQEMLRRYFSTCGPASLADAAYFFGVPQSRLRHLMKELPLRFAVLDGETYFFLDEWTNTAKVPKCLLLGGFDPLMLCYEKRRSPMVPPEHLRGVFGLAGIVYPVILLHGRAIGRWKRAGRRLDLTLFAPLEEAERKAIWDTAEQEFPALQIRWSSDGV